ncbi:hypothetical protein G7054_g7005 [Neopestalotiopsis clavispora]|nr:hypothetical protein G7054_g7005 [Neopestalotiopsis clavispora]
MVAIKSLLALAACLCAPSVLANAAPGTESFDDLSIRASNSSIGITFTPFGEKSCKGTASKDIINVDKGKTACANISKEKSAHISAGLCKESKLEFYEKVGCEGKAAKTSHHDAGCLELSAKYPSVKIVPHKC